MLYIPQKAWIFTRLTRYQSGNHFVMSGGDLLSLHTQPHKLGIFPQFTSSIPMFHWQFSLCLSICVSWNRSLVAGSMSIYVLARKISCNIMTYHDIYQHILACLVSESPIVFTSFHVSNVPEWCTSIGRSPRWDRSNPWRWCPAEGRWKNRRDTGVMGGSCMPKTSKNQACSPQMFVFLAGIWNYMKLC